jgi:hypothetical protein
VTPFDGVALLAMLVAFYPVVGPAALRRARDERPEYFAGGEIRGTEGDKLWLGDGRKFDLILKVNTPGQAWQVLELFGVDGAAAPDDPFQLEAGPLVPFDLSAFQPPAHDDTFTPLAAAAVGELNAVDGALHLAHTTLSDAADPAALDALDADGAGDLDGAIDQAHRLLDDADPGALLATTNSHDAAITANEAGLNELEPGEMPPAPEPIQTPPIETPNPNPDMPGA